MDIEFQLLKFNEIISKELRKSKLTSLGEKDYSNISLSQGYYISSLYNLGRVTLSEYASALGLTKPSVTAIVNKLENKGFIAKEQSLEDKRVFYVSVTEKGKIFKESEKDPYMDLSKRIRAILDGGEIAVLEKALEKIIESYE